MSTIRLEKSLKSVAAAIGLSGSVFLASPASASSEPFIGEIATFPYNFCPRGWAETDGRLLQIREHTALFSLLGTEFGGDGRSTFALPNMSSPRLKHCIALVGIFPSRS